MQNRMTMTCSDTVRNLRWHQAPYAFIDVEGAGGARGQPTALVEVAVVGLAADDEVLFESLVNPGRPIRPITIRLHGLRDVDVIDAPPIERLCPSLAEVLNDRVAVAHAAGVDWRVLAAACPALRPLAVLDSLRLARALLPGGHHGLDALADRLGCPVATAAAGAGASRHRARSDAAVTARMFRRLVESTRPKATVGELLDLAEHRWIRAQLLPGCEGVRPSGAHPPPHPSMERERDDQSGIGCCQDRP